MKCGSKIGNQRRPDDEDHLVQHGFDCESGVQQRRTVEPQRPTSAYRRSAMLPPSPTPMAAARLTPTAKPALPR
jgi:hypothetical protein